jgi:hypothetical protein
VLTELAAVDGPLAFHTLSEYPAGGCLSTPCVYVSEGPHLDFVIKYADGVYIYRCVCVYMYMCTHTLV